MVRVNAYPDLAREAGTILDLCGGPGPLSAHVNRDAYRYIVVDNDPTALRRGEGLHLRVCADALATPFRDGSMDLVVTMTCAQFFPKEALFAEVRRLLRPGGVMAMHENGAWNPLILFARLAQRINGLYHRHVWEYRNTIVAYIRPDISPPGFEVLHRDSFCLLTPLILGLEKIGLGYWPRLHARLHSLDMKLLRTFPVLRHFCFLHVIHLRRT